MKYDRDMRVWLLRWSPIGRVNASARLGLFCEGLRFGGPGPLHTAFSFCASWASVVRSSRFLVCLSPLDLLSFVMVKHPCRFFLSIDPLCGSDCTLVARRSFGFIQTTSWNYYWIGLQWPRFLGQAAINRS